MSNITSGNIQLPVNDIMDGTYILSIRDGQKVVNRKFVKQ